MDDYISRQATIEAFENADKDVMADYGEHYGCEWGFSSEAVNNTINSILSEKVKPIVYGKWAHLGGDEWCCTACGNVIHTEGSWEKLTKKFCDECGADMREEQNEADLI